MSRVLHVSVKTRFDVIVSKLGLRQLFVVIESKSKSSEDSLKVKVDAIVVSLMIAKLGFDDDIIKVGFVASKLITEELAKSREFPTRSVISELRETTRLYVPGLPLVVTDNSAAVEFAIVSVPIEAWALPVKEKSFAFRLVTGSLKYK